MSTGSACSNQSKLTILVVQSVGSRCSQSNSSSSERMSKRQGTSPQIKFIHWQRSNLSLSSHIVLSEPIGVQCLQIRQNLTGKGFMELKHADVRYFQTCTLKHFGSSICWAKKIDYNNQRCLSKNTSKYLN